MIDWASSDYTNTNDNLFYVPDIEGLVFLRRDKNINDHLCYKCNTQVSSNTNTPIVDTTKLITSEDNKQFKPPSILPNEDVIGVPNILDIDTATTTNPSPRIVEPPTILPPIIDPHPVIIQPSEPVLDLGILETFSSNINNRPIINQYIGRGVEPYYNKEHFRGVYNPFVENKNGSIFSTNILLLFLIIILFLVFIELRISNMYKKLKNREFYKYNK